MDTSALTAASHRVYCAALHCLCQQRHVCEARYTKSVESCSWASEFICIHSTACLSSEPILITSSSGLLQQCTSSHPLSLEEKKGLLLVHSCSFDTTLSLAGEDALHIGLFAVKPGYFLPFYCQSQKKNSGRICVQTQLLHTVFLLWLVWDGGRRGMSLYKRNNGWKDPEACKRWICALITVIAAAAFHLLSYENLVTPSFLTTDSDFLLRAITRTMKGSWMAQHCVIFLHACSYAPAQIGGRWQWLGAVQQWQGQEGSGHGRVLGKDQLSSAYCYSTRLLAGRRYFNLHKKVLHG